MNNRHFRYILIAIGVLLLGVVLYPKSPGKDQIDPYDLVDKALRSEDNVSYKAKREYSFLDYGKTVRYSKRVSIHGGLQTNADRVNSLIKENYNPILEGEDVIAGRETWAMRLMPKEKHFPWKQLWIDKKTHIVLASRDWSSRAKIKRSMKTLSISHIALHTSDVFSQNQNAVYVRADSIDGMYPHYLPTGYVKIDSRYNERLGDNCLNYSDGLNTISVFVDKNIVGKEEKKHLLRAASGWGQGLIMSKNIKDKLVILVADLPDEEMNKIVSSVR